MNRICASLAENGYDVLLLGRTEGHSIPIIEKSYQQKRLKSIFQNGFLMYAEYNIRLFFFLLGNKFDLINAVDLDSMVPGYLISKLKGKKCIYDAHEYFTEVPELVHRPFVKKVWELIANVFIKRVTAAYTVGPGLQKIFSDKYGINFSLVRNVPHFQKSISSQTQEQNLILYQGALNKGRGLKQMIAAMKSLPNYKLMIIGEGDLSSQLRALAAGQSNVKFVGHVIPSELPAYTAKAWIGINLLENAGLSYYYSLANRTFDFIQAGIPSIHMKFPEYEAVQEQYKIGILIDDLEETSIIDAVKEYENKEFYNAVKKNNEIARKELTWENEVERLLLIYEELC